MITFVGTAILCLVVGVRSALLWNQAGAGVVLLASLVYSLGCFAAIIVLNVPLNNQLSSIADPSAAITLSAVLFTVALCRS